jgi:hypothetical protein
MRSRPWRSILGEESQDKYYEPIDETTSTSMCLETLKLEVGYVLENWLNLYIIALWWYLTMIIILIIFFALGWNDRGRLYVRFRFTTKEHISCLWNVKNVNVHYEICKHFWNQTQTWQKATTKSWSPFR